MKKIVALALALLTFALMFASCGKEVVGIVSKYSGEPIEVLDKDHEFTADDFTVWVMYKVEQGQEVTKDFTFEVTGMTEEYYVVEITYKDLTEPCYVWIGEETAE